MDFPNDFSQQAKAKVVLAEIKARAFVEKGSIAFSHVPGIIEHAETALVFQYIATVFAAFAHECCELGRSGLWDTVRVDREARSGLRSIALGVCETFDSQEYHLPEMFSSRDGALAPKIQRVLEATPEWAKYRDELLEVAETQSLPSIGVTGAQMAGSLQVSAPDKDPRNLVELPGPEVLDDSAEASTTPSIQMEMQKMENERRSKVRFKLPKEATRKRGRRPNADRRSAIQKAILKHGDEWRNHLDDIFKELDEADVYLGDFQPMKIDLEDGESIKVENWGDLGLANGAQRNKIIDVLRKYI